MERFVGVANCADETEAANIVGRAAFISGVKINQTGLEVEIIFEPDDRCSSLEESRTIKRILDLIEPVQNHGISMIC